VATLEDAYDEGVQRGRGLVGIEGELRVGLPVSSDPLEVCKRLLILPGGEQEAEPLLMREARLGCRIEGKGVIAQQSVQGRDQFWQLTLGDVVTGELQLVRSNRGLELRIRHMLDQRLQRVLPFCSLILVVLEVLPERVVEGVGVPLRDGSLETVELLVGQRAASRVELRELRRHALRLVSGDERRRAQRLRDRVPLLLDPRRHTLAVARLRDSSNRQLSGFPIPGGERELLT